jgi:hypothetical protein
MGARTKTAKYAVGFTFGAFFLILVAFSTPYWLQTDGELENPKFLNLGKLKKHQNNCQFVRVWLYETPNKNINFLMNHF